MDERMRSVQIENKVKIIRVPIPTPTLWPNTTTNSYLIGNEQESLLVDAGYDQQDTKKEIERAIKENGLAQPKSIILTHSHRDHAPGVRQLINWSPIVYCHNNERQEIMEAISPLKELSLLNEGDIIKVADLEITVIHGPGHTAGQLNLYIPSQQVLIAGDNIVSKGTTWIGPPEGNMSDYIDTLNRLKQLKLTKIGPGHGEWVLNPYEKIEFILNRRLYRESQIMSLLEEHKHLSSTSLTKIIYENKIHPSIFDVAKRTTEAHLIKLMKEGTVLQQDSVYSIKS
jgi:ribonuclease/clavin/mitogillin